MEKNHTYYIAVCPNHCNASFVTEAKIIQKWEVDAYGGCICVKDEEVESDVPYMESWKCSKCGARAKKYECAGFAFKEDGLTGTLLVPRYPLTEGYLFWDDRKSGGFQSLPIGCGIHSVPHAVMNGYTFWLPAPGMGMGTVTGFDVIRFGDALCGGMHLYFSYPRQECDGQMKLFATA